jgi:hypothetical protein
MHVTFRFEYDWYNDVLTFTSCGKEFEPYTLRDMLQIPTETFDDFINDIKEYAKKTYIHRPSQLICGECSKEQIINRTYTIEILNNE